MGGSLILHSKPTVGQDDINAVLEVLQTAHLEDGSYVRTLEDIFKEKYGFGYASGISSGFAGIHLALIALEVGKGDQVILPSYSCSALLNPILMLGATPVIVDVEENSFNISPEQVACRINVKTKAIIVPHIFGFPAAIDVIKSFGVPVVEDCAQAIGGKLNQQALGSFGDMAVFSFYASKMISGGDGGMIITADESYYKTILDYRYYGHKKMHRALAYNYKLTNMPAALVISQLRKLDEFVAKRKKIASVYNAFFAHNEQVKIDFKGAEESCYYRYPVAVSQDVPALIARMKAAEIYCGYGVLEGLHELQGLNPQSFPNTEKNLKHIISLPIYPDLSEHDVIRVAETLNNFLL